MVSLRSNGAVTETGWHYTGRAGVFPKLSLLRGSWDDARGKKAGIRWASLSTHSIVVQFQPPHNLHRLASYPWRDGSLPSSAYLFANSTNKHRISKLYQILSQKKKDYNPASESLPLIYWALYEYVWGCSWWDRVVGLLIVSPPQCIARHKLYLILGPRVQRCAIKISIDYARGSVQILILLVSNWAI